LFVFVRCFNLSIERERRRRRRRRRRRKEGRNDNGQYNSTAIIEYGWRNYFQKLSSKDVTN